MNHMELATLVVIQNKAPLGPGGANIPLARRCFKFPKEQARTHGVEIAALMRRFMGSDYSISLQTNDIICTDYEDAAQMINMLFPPPPLP